MCYYSVISQRPFKIAQLSSIKARPTLSINGGSLSLSPSLLPPSLPHLQTRPTQHLMALRSLRSREATTPLWLIKGSFPLDELIKRQVGSKACFFFSPENSWARWRQEFVGGKISWLTKEEHFCAFRGLAWKQRSMWCHVFQKWKSISALTFSRSCQGRFFGKIKATFCENFCQYVAIVCFRANLWKLNYAASCPPINWSWTASCQFALQRTRQTRWHCAFLSKKKRKKKKKLQPSTPTITFCVLFHRVTSGSHSAPSRPPSASASKPVSLREREHMSAVTSSPARRLVLLPPAFPPGSLLPSPTSLTQPSIRRGGVLSGPPASLPLSLPPLSVSHSLLTNLFQLISPLKLTPTT